MNLESTLHSATRSSVRDGRAGCSSTSLEEGGGLTNAWHVWVRGLNTKSNLELLSLYMTANQRPV